MPNRQYFVAQQGPGSAGLLRFALVETSAGSGVFSLSFDEASLDQATSPSLASAIAAGASRLSAQAHAVPTDTAAVPAIQPSIGNNGAVFITNRTTTTTTYTLPAAQTAGLQFSFILGNVGTELLINPAGTDTISIKGANTATAANITTAAGAGIKNTAATHILGDTITLVSDGVSQWKMLCQSGTWAAQ